MAGFSSLRPTSVQIITGRRPKHQPSFQRSGILHNLQSSRHDCCHQKRAACLHARVFDLVPFIVLCHLDAVRSVQSSSPAFPGRATVKHSEVTRRVTSVIPSLNPFTPKSDQFQISAAASLRNTTSHSMENLVFHSLLR